MPGTREIRRRIKSVKNTGKITRAMEMISSVKMRKAAAGVAALRPYAKSTWNVLRAVSRARDVREKLPLFAERPLNKQLFVVVTSNRGLCGSFNTQMFRRLRVEIETISKEHPKASIDFASLGRKGDSGLRFLKGEIVASFPEVIAMPSVSEIRSIAKFLFDGFEAGRWDHISIAYTDFVSALTQKPRIHRILPFAEHDAEEQIAEMGNGREQGTMNKEQKTMNNEQGTGTGIGKKVSAEYVVEPSPEVVLKTLLFRLVETQILHAVLESNASQEAARMVAMHSATDAAHDMTESFTLLYNQLRQAKVTQEIAELSAGMAAVA